jgi:uncharacterized membrane protein HdeD (DUF308 family)
MVGAGVVACLLGLFLLANPFAAIWILGVIIGVSLVVTGVAEVLASRQAGGPWWPAWVVGGVLIVAGLVAAAWPDATLWVLAVVAGLALALGGAVGIVTALAGPAEGRGVQLVLAGISLVIGIVVLAWPDATLVVLALLVGLRTLVAGVISIAIGVNILRLGD